MGEGAGFPSLAATRSLARLSHVALPSLARCFFFLSGVRAGAARRGRRARARRPRTRALAAWVRTDACAFPGTSSRRERGRSRRGRSRRLFRVGSWDFRSVLLHRQAPAGLAGSGPCLRRTPGSCRTRCLRHASLSLSLSLGACESPLVRASRERERERDLICSSVLVCDAVCMPEGATERASWASHFIVSP